jgi:hypothetical protein
MVKQQSVTKFDVKLTPIGYNPPEMPLTEALDVIRQLVLLKSTVLSIAILNKL